MCLAHALSKAQSKSMDIVVELCLLDAKDTKPDPLMVWPLGLGGSRKERRCTAEPTSCMRSRRAPRVSGSTARTSNPRA
jgi:hypothetical protein